MYAPENTVASFKAALGKADLVETDARPSADNVLVIMHDATVDRTTDGTGNVSSMTVAQLKLVDAGSWFSPAFTGERIPTLEEMITNTLPGAIPLIEHKGGTAAAYSAELRRLGVVTKVVVQSFDWAFLTSLHQIEPTLKLGALGSGTFTATSLTNILNTGAQMVAWEQGGVNAQMLAMVRDAGLSLFVWTVDGPQIKTFIDMGVDGIISNDPASVRNYQTPATNGPVALADGLISYWKMDDGLQNTFATVVTDSKGTNNATLTRNDGASHWFSTGLARVGGTLKVEGTNAYVTMPSNDSMNINTNGVSLSIWVKLSALPSQLSANYGSIFDSTTDCYVLYLDKANKELRFKVTDVNGNAARPGIPEAQLRTNEWLLITATYSGSALPSAGQTIIYMNGQMVDIHTGSDSSSPVGLTGNVKTGQVAGIGREGGTGGNPFVGFVDELALWKRALNYSEVKAIYTAGQESVGLADLIRTPTTLIRCEAAVSSTTPGAVTIKFVSEGGWQSFRLLQADSVAGEFKVVEGLTPVDLGNGVRGFTYAVINGAAKYFRVEGQ